VEITDSTPDSVLAAAAKTHAFEIGDWIFTALPAISADLFEPVPAPPAPAVSSTEPVSAATEHVSAAVSATSAPVTVTTEPLGVPDATAAKPAE
jgi:hypothetical protein